MNICKFGLYLITFFSILLCGCSNNNSEIISPKNAKVEVINNGALLVDVRPKEQYDEEHLGGAISLPISEIENADNIIPSKDKIIIVYCNSGVNSKIAKEKLNNLGYKNVYNLGAMSNWYE